MPNNTKFRQFLKNCREWIWPTMGWRRFTRFQITKLSRMTGGKKAISLGFACGAAISFTPFIGFHFVISAIFAKFIRGNIIAAMIGTGLGNPWTFPFIWPASYGIGKKILNKQRDDASSFDETLSISTLMTNPFEIFFPMLVGCLPLAAIVWVMAYFLMRHALNWRERRSIRKQR